MEIGRVGGESLGYGMRNLTVTRTIEWQLDDSDWLYRLLQNCFSYGVLLIPLNVLSYLAKRSDLQLGRWIRRYSNRGFLKWYIFGQRVSSELDASTADVTAPQVHPVTNCDRVARLAFCFVGLQVSYVTWGVLQEKMMTQTYERLSMPGTMDRFGDSEFIVFVNRLVSTLLGAVAVLFTRSRDGTYAPLHSFSHASVANIVSSWCQYEALKFITFPAQVLGKSCKILAVMLMGKVIQHRSYAAHQYLSAVLLTVGMILFLISTDVTTSRMSASRTTTAGLALMIGYLLLDSFTSNWQNALFDAYRIPAVHMMAGVNMFSCILSLFALVTHRHLSASAYFIVDHKHFAADILIASACSSVGQFFIFYTIGQFGAVAFTVMMTIRQALSILASCLLYNHPIGPVGVVGILLVFLALFMKTLWNHVRPASAHSRSRHTVV